MSKLNLNEQARQILKIAENHGMESNFFFFTTFQRYQLQIGILNYLKKTILDEGTLVTKEYVKVKKTSNLTPQFRIITSGNKTVVTLIKIITTLLYLQNGDEPDPLLEKLNIAKNVSNTGKKVMFYIQEML